MILLSTIGSYSILLLTIHYMLSWKSVSIGNCPGFGQDRVNFHRTPGRGTARGGWPNPNLTKQSRVFHTMCLMLGSAAGELGGGNSLALGSMQRRQFGRVALL